MPLTSLILYGVFQYGEFIAGKEERDEIEANSMSSYDGVRRNNDEVANFQVDIQNFYPEVFHYRFHFNLFILLLLLQYYSYQNCSEKLLGRYSEHLLGSWQLHHCFLSLHRNYLRISFYFISLLFLCNKFSILKHAI